MGFDRHYLTDPEAVAAAAHAAGVAAAYHHNAENSIRQGIAVSEADANRGVHYAQLYAQQADHAATRQARLAQADSAHRYRLQQERERQAFDQQQAIEDDQRAMEKQAQGDEQATQRIMLSHELVRGDYDHQLDAQSRRKVEQARADLEQLDKFREQMHDDEYRRAQAQIMTGVKNIRVKPQEPDLIERLKQNGQIGGDIPPGATMFQQQDGKIEYRPPPKTEKDDIPKKKFDAYLKMAGQTDQETGKPLSHETIKKHVDNAFEFAYGQGDNPQPAGNKQPPVKVNSPDEAMALAPGTEFVTPDGRVKVRP